ncbi:glycoside hydrolase/phage tail family protein [Jannaschia sp. W003]|uniref:baseplate multidomain protein megatron n=1 Tax=Jannaschia sp. W003 TaxID=2867012 RepID=UPI0021A350FF|nr:glycoside hydrolase/phage tail family protein [Jannaschia sp. W003]UWQ20997.1 glycoside hydrolase/phage tail family protein [Jannaschia sp. W003]
MATLVLGAIGASVGGSIGGSVLGLSGAVIGRAVGAAAGRAIDQRVLGGGSEAVEHGRIDRLRLSSAAEGAPIPQVWGRMRVAGQVIWCTPFEETSETTGGGKGGPPKPEVTEYSYSVSLAIALCEGTILRVGRVWADGRELALDEVPMRVYAGDEAQLPDPLIEAVEGEGRAPAYRGTAYVVIEDLALGRFGNRVPQFSFEVVRPADAAGEVAAPHDMVRGVALIPGTGEFALATERVSYTAGGLETRSANVNSAAEAPDFTVSLRNLVEEAPALRSVSLVVSWFGDDLRCGQCTIRPKVEAGDVGSAPMVWAVSGVERGDAAELPRVDGNAIYGGTPADAAVMQAVRAINAEGLDCTYYPFILMDQLAGNGLPDPWGGAEQAPLPWRGRITQSVAAGRAGSPDCTAAADAEVAAFFGTAAAADFAVSSVAGTDGLGGAATETPTVRYAGPAEWSYRRFVLHQAALCAAAGGVEAFCIGSEMVGMTTIRGAGGAYPAVAALRALLSEVRVLLPGAKLSYAADWSEYFGHHPQDGSGDVRFHLDPLWADPEIAFVGIDNYMPLSDWRDGRDHADAGWGDVRDLGYLRSNVEGGEGYDWYYPSPEARAAQRRVPIEDGAHGEPWVYRYKDLRGWWENAHHERRGGVREAAPTPWMPGSKPVRFTEYGCAAVDRGTNQPNKFLDPKSSESALPYHSRGTRDDAIQMQYIRATLGYWGAASRNPVSPHYGGPMVDLDHSLLWCWDTRPWPAFPANGGLWSDAANYPFGHWWSGRSGAQPLASVIAEICRAAGVAAFDVSQVYGAVRGFAARDVASARADLQPLMMAHGVEAAERDGVLVFRMRGNAEIRAVDAGEALLGEGESPAIEEMHAPEAELAGRVRVHHGDADGRFEARVGEAVLPGGPSVPVSDTELPMALTGGEGSAIAERFLAEARLSRDAVRLALPPSRRDVAPGDLLRIGALDGLWRVDRLEEGSGLAVEAVRADPAVYDPPPPGAEAPGAEGYVADGRVDPILLDLPLLGGSEVPHAPHVAARARPWPGAVSVLSAAEDAGYALDTVLRRGATAGLTEGPLAAAAPGVLDRGAPLRVRFGGGTPRTLRDAAFLGGGNLAAIGDGRPDGWELFQFQAADPVEPGLWDLRLRLRGLRGTEGAMRASWPAGSLVVLVDGALRQLGTAAEAVGLERHLRIGPARFALDHDSYRHVTVTPRAVGLRPYAPAHLRMRDDGGTHRFAWVRRTRVGGDGWDAEVPLGEEREAYALRAVAGGATVWEGETAAPAFAFDAAARGAAGIDGAYRMEVAQVGAGYGPGAWAGLPVP